jgi:hypothetical protein
MIENGYQDGIVLSKMIAFLKAILIIFGSSLAGGFFGFFGMFVVAQFLPENPAYSFMTFYTVPAGLLLGLIIGLIIVFN